MTANKEVARAGRARVTPPSGPFLDRTIPAWTHLASILERKLFGILCPRAKDRTETGLPESSDSSASRDNAASAYSPARVKLRHFAISG